MNTRRPCVVSLSVLLAGCVQPYANFISEGVPSAVALKGRPVATRLPPDASATERNYERIVTAELQRTGFKIAAGNIKPELVMNIAIDRTQKVTGFSTGIRLWGSRTHYEETAAMTVRLSLIHAGQTIWDGRIDGDAGVLLGKYSGGCARTLLELYSVNHAGMEYCYW